MEHYHNQASEQADYIRRLKKLPAPVKIPGNVVQKLPEPLGFSFSPISHPYR